jgi:uncharacterized protein YneF (UPF0154 family)
MMMVIVGRVIGMELEIVIAWRILHSYLKEHNKIKEER